MRGRNRCCQVDDGDFFLNFFILCDPAVIAMLFERRWERFLEIVFAMRYFSSIIFINGQAKYLFSA